MNKMEANYFPTACPGYRGPCNEPGVSVCGQRMDIPLGEALNFTKCSFLQDALNQIQDNIKLFGSNIIGARSK